MNAPIRLHAPPEPEEATESAMDRIKPEYFRLWRQITFGDHEELESPQLCEIQDIWESFGEVSIHTDSARWVERLRTTGAAADRILGTGAWEYILYQGRDYLEARDHDAREKWRKRAAQIKATPNPAIRKIREQSLAKEIAAHFTAFAREQRS
ncbi:MAG: hypothetical protein JWO82_2112 [Akkermansiaceae bacterium]|nr:hypothetical protein [Akkermansiaceae bacterium]